MHWGELIRDLRETCGFDQAHAAKLFGVSVETLSGWESGASTPGPAVRTRILDIVSREVQQLEDRGIASTTSLSEVLRACTAIHAASTGDLDMLIQSTLSGVALDCTDYDLRTPLHLAAAEGHAEIVAFLLAHGADTRPRDRWGATPAECAIRFKHWEIVELIAQAAPPAPGVAEPDHERALSVILAASRGDLHQLEYIALAGGALDVADYDGRTPLHLAAAEGHASVVSFLLGHGVRPDPIDRWGDTPADSAAKAGHASIVAHLRSRDRPS